jgi:mRNA interferase MazF
VGESRPAPRRGEIYWVDWSPARGSEPAGRRPAVIVQGDAGNLSESYPNTIVAVISTHGREIPLHVRLRPSHRTGLRTTSFVKCEQLMTIAKDRLSARALGKLDAREVREVDAAILLSLGLVRAVV